MKRILGRVVGVGVVVAAGCVVASEWRAYARYNAIYEEAKEQSRRLDEEFEQSEWRRLEALAAPAAGRKTG